MPNGSMDQDKTWHKSRPRPRPHYVTWRPSFPSPKGAQPPIFGPYLLWPNRRMEQDATWYGGRLRPRPHCVRWEPDAPKKGHSSPTSWLMFIVAKRLDRSRCHLVRRWASAQTTLCYMGIQLPPQLGHSPQFSAMYVYCSQTVAHLRCC